MAYCSLTDVNNMVPQSPFTDASKPSAGSVTAWIDDISVRMDAVLVNIGYVTPVSVARSPQSVQLLKMINAIGALGLAQAARATNVNSTLDVSGHNLKNIWLQRYDQEMQALADPQNPFELVDAARTGAQLEKQPENVLRSSVQGVASDTWLTPNVTRHQVL